MFASGFDEILHSLPDGWLTADFDLRVEEAEYPGANDLRAADAPEVLRLCAAYRSPDPLWHYCFRIGSRDGAGVRRRWRIWAMRRLDGGRLRGDVLLVGAETDSPIALQKWQRPDHLRAVGAERREVVETAGGGFTLGPAG